MHRLTRSIFEDNGNSKIPNPWSLMRRQLKEHLDTITVRNTQDNRCRCICTNELYKGSLENRKGADKPRGR